MKAFYLNLFFPLKNIYKQKINFFFIKLNSKKIYLLQFLSVSSANRH